MSERILQVANDLWNIRGDFKIGGILNIAAHALMVKYANGKLHHASALALRKLLCP